MGRLDHGLFVPAGLLKTKPRFKTHSQILDKLPMALLRGSAGIRQALQQEAGKHRISLDVRLWFSSYPQLAQALQSMNVAVFMPTLAADSLPPGSFQLLRLPFLNALSRRLSLVWNKKVADVRPAIGQFSKALALAFQNTARTSRSLPVSA